MKKKWVVSCEHGGKQIPLAYASLFKEAATVLQTHRGYDPGAFALYQLLARHVADFSQHSQTSRLLIELNRSLHHKSLFSSYTRALPTEVKEEIIASYYLPYRKAVEDKIREYTEAGEEVLHLSIHSFTPELNGEVRKADIGLLYDPARPQEKEFCRRWKQRLQQFWPGAVVRMNYPYLGTADGFTTYLRKRFPRAYAGIELELNQQYAGNQAVYEKIRQSLQELKG